MNHHVFGCPQGDKIRPLPSAATASPRSSTARSPRAPGHTAPLDWGPSALRRAFPLSKALHNESRTQATPDTSRCLLMQGTHLVRRSPSTTGNLLKKPQGAVQAQGFCHDFPKPSMCPPYPQSWGFLYPCHGCYYTQWPSKPIYFVMDLPFGVCLPWEIKRQYARSGPLSTPWMEAAASSHREK